MVPRTRTAERFDTVVLYLHSNGIEIWQIVPCAILHEECTRGAHLPFLSIRLTGGYTTELCDAWLVRSQTIFPAAGHHRPLNGTRLYCLMTEAYLSEQLAQACYLKGQGQESNM